MSFDPLLGPGLLVFIFAVGFLAGAAYGALKS